MAARYWPLGSGRKVTSPFGPRSGGYHYGVDFGRDGGSGGMPVYAVQSGTVIHAGAAQGYGGPDPAGWLVIDSTTEEGGGCLEYGHIIREVARGDRVAAGQRIGRINPDTRTNGGTARNPVAPHLHLSDMPREYNPAAKQDPMPRLRGALEPEGTQPVSKIWSGRATWLYDVLKAELGSDRVTALPGWENRGHGDFKDMRGVMLHHTGNSRESAQSIANGRPDLAGPLSNLHIGRDGKVTVVAAGVCWHAGAGSLPWVQTNMGNWYLLGYECAWPDIGPGGSYDPHQRWPDAQVIAMRDASAAVLGYLGYVQDRLTMHKTYAGRAQGKWDPGNMDLGWMQGEVRKDLDGYVFPGERPEGVSLPPSTPLPVQKPPITAPGAWSDILLWNGMPGPNAQVRELQRRIKAAYANTHGKLVGAIDGWYGPATERAVTSFQRAAGLDPDGIVGPLTAAALNLKVV